MILILTVIAHLLWFAVMTERKYSLKKTLLLYGFYAVFFTLWSLLAFSLLGKDSPYVIPFSFIGTILPAFLLFLYTSSDTFCKKLFLLITYANLFCIFICLRKYPWHQADTGTHAVPLTGRPKGAHLFCR